MKRAIKKAAALLSVVAMCGTMFLNFPENSFVLSAFSADSGVAINEDNFPDEIFREYVKSFDTSGDNILSDEETAKVFLNTDFGENLVPDGVTPYLESMVTVQINDFDELLFKALRYKGDEKTTYYVDIKSSITNKDYRLVEIEVPSKRYAKRLKRNAQMIALCKYMLCDI